MKTNVEANGELVPRRSYQSMTLDAARQLTPAPPGIGAWAEKLREAAYNAVKETDVEELMQVYLKKAKEGDQKAAKFVLDFLTGGAPKVQLQTVIVHKKTRSSQRQARADRAAPNPGEAPARPPAAEPGGPSVRVLRRLACHFLSANGPSPGPALTAHLELNPDELETVMECELFALKGGQWSLTPAGKREVG